MNYATKFDPISKQRSRDYFCSLLRPHDVVLTTGGAPELFQNILSRIVPENLYIIEKTRRNFTEISDFIGHQWHNRHNPEFLPVLINADVFRILPRFVDGERIPIPGTRLSLHTYPLPTVIWTDIYGRLDIKRWQIFTTWLPYLRELMVTAYCGGRINRMDASGISAKDMLMLLTVLPSQFQVRRFECREKAGSGMFEWHIENKNPLQGNEFGKPLYRRKTIVDTTIAAMLMDERLRYSDIARKAHLSRQRIAQIAQKLGLDGADRNRRVTVHRLVEVLFLLARTPRKTLNGGVVQLAQSFSNPKNRTKKRRSLQARKCIYIPLEKLRKSREAIRKLTGRCEGRKPYGYNPSEQKVIKKILQLHERGASYSEIAEKLNKWKVPTRALKRWYPMTISRIIRTCTPEKNGDT